VKKNNAGGTGIGLALVEAFAKMHGGKAEVESEVGKGTTFTVTLPIDQPGFEYTVVEMPEKGESIERNYSSTKSISSLEEVEKTPIEKMTSAEMVEADGQKSLLLVIDDNDDVRSYVSALLKDEYVVIQSADGKSGLERAVKEVPDLVICDVMMPVMDGLEFCKRLKQEVATSHIPVLMLTARTMEEQRAEGYEYGADAYITKPFNNKVLISRVRNLLENRKRLKSLFGGADADIITQKPTDADAKFMYQFRKLVQQRMGDSELNVEVIAAEMGLSRVQLYRKVKALTDASPVEMIRMSRLNRAKILLSKGDRNVSEVAYEVGFSSPSYFSKCYKEQFGHLPAEEMKNEE
jgi:DNA-binding response OmpR family regulator